MKKTKLGLAKYSVEEINTALTVLEAFWTGRRPSGRTDNAGRWYPLDNENQDCCGNIRWPSRSWPLSLLKHCQTLAHIETREGVKHEVVLAVKKALKGLGLDPIANQMAFVSVEDEVTRLRPELMALREQAALASVIGIGSVQSGSSTSL